MSDIDFEAIEETWQVDSPKLVALGAYLSAPDGSTDADRVLAACRAYVTAAKSNGHELVSSELLGNIQRKLSEAAYDAAYAGDAAKHDHMVEAHHMVEVMMPGQRDNPLIECDCVEKYNARQARGIS